VQSLAGDLLVLTGHVAGSAAASRDCSGVRRKLGIRETALKSTTFAKLENAISWMKSRTRREWHLGISTIRSWIYPLLDLSAL
jgi:antibiotic biosynthesis monooxygenase (ABM) superfamily enzyme